MPRRASGNVALPEAAGLQQPVIRIESSVSDHRLVELLGVFGPSLLVAISGRIEAHPQPALNSHARSIPVSAAPVRDRVLTGNPATRIPCGTRPQSSTTVRIGATLDIQRPLPLLV